MGEDNVEALILESRNALEAPTASEPTGGPFQSGKRNRKTTSQKWSHFELLSLAKDGKKRYKCGAIYMCESLYGTGNLRRHI